MKGHHHEKHENRKESNGRHTRRYYGIKCGVALIGVTLVPLLSGLLG